MNGFLIDTNVLSEYNRPAGPDSGVRLWLETTARSLQHVSVITLAEIQKGIELLQQGRRRTELVLWLKQDLETWFAGRILPVDRRVAAHWASLVAASIRGGRPLPTIERSGAIGDSHRSQAPISQEAKSRTSWREPPGLPPPESSGGILGKPPRPRPTQHRAGVSSHPLFRGPGTRCRLLAPRRTADATPKQGGHVRLDADVLSWLKSKGKDHQTRLNAMLRAQMESDQQARSSKKSSLSPLFPLRPP